MGHSLPVTEQPFQDVRPYSGVEDGSGRQQLYNIDRSDTFGRRRMDTEGEK